MLTLNDEQEEERLVHRDAEQADADHQELLDPIRHLKRWRAAALCCIFALAIAVVLLLLDSKHRINFHRHTAWPSSPVPLMPTVLVTFERNDTFAAPSTPENDRAWAAIAPPGDGFVLFSNNTRDAHNLPLGIHSSQGSIYDISLFHQLHCLTGIREHLWTLNGTLGRDDAENVYEMVLKGHEQHVFHCLDYIRQALMCAGDMTVEWPRTDPDGRMFAVDGWGVTHQCKDWDAIVKWMRENTIAKYS